MTTDTAAADNSTKSMDEIMSLCKRRGFIYQASEIYGGINGFWDYGPLGAILKKNLRDAWWKDVIMLGAGGATGPNGKPVTIVPLDTCIIQNPKVWEASGHLSGFNDPMVQCTKEGCKKLYRADHLIKAKLVPVSEIPAEGMSFTHEALANARQSPDAPFFLAVDPGNNYEELEDPIRARLGDKRAKIVLRHEQGIAGPPVQAVYVESKRGNYFVPLTIDLPQEPLQAGDPCPNCGGDLSEPRAFNLMFPTVIGATGDVVDDKAYLRPETAQGIFVNFKNVVDTMRVRVPFGIGGTGKSFRNEVTPRNFTFRSREFEQMEMEFFCHPDDARAWYEFWRDSRHAWWQSIGLTSGNLQLREHDQDELAHYAKEGEGTCDIEYKFPFTAPGFGELEGVAHRADFDLKQHQEHSKTKMEYFDTERGEIGKNGAPKGEKYIPHCIEPAAGLDRGVLALLCEAYTPDPDRASKVYMKFHPRMAPIKAAVFPLVNKDGMPEIAEKLHADLAKTYAETGMVAYDAKQSIGKRYARMDEAGCPFCFTVDSETLSDNTVTVRHRDTLDQERIAIDKVSAFLGDKLGL